MRLLSKMINALFCCMQSWGWPIVVYVRYVPNQYFLALKAYCTGYRVLTEAVGVTGERSGANGLKTLLSSECEKSYSLCTL